MFCRPLNSNILVAAFEVKDVQLVNKQLPPDSFTPISYLAPPSLLLRGRNSVSVVFKWSSLPTLFPSQSVHLITCDERPAINQTSCTHHQDFVSVLPSPPLDTRKWYTLCSKRENKGLNICLLECYRSQILLLIFLSLRIYIYIFYIYIYILLIPMWSLLIWLKYAMLQTLLLFYYSIKIYATACRKTNKHRWSLL